MKLHFGICIIFGITFTLFAHSQEPVGIFDGYADIGDVGFEGAAGLDGDFYQLEASGSGLDDFSDSCFFVYKELSGNFTIEGIPLPLGGGEAGLMIRQNLEPGSPFAAYVVQSNGSVYPRFRTVQDEAMTDETSISIDSLLDGTIRLERIGNTIHFYTLDVNGEWALQQTESIQFVGPIYVGLVAAANDNENLEFFDTELVAINEYPFSVARSLSSDAPSPGDAITVTLSANASSISNATVSEIIPDDASAINIAVTGGEFSQDIDGSILWILSDFSGQAELTYSIQLPSSPVTIWQGTFTDGAASGYIGGKMYVSETSGFQTRGTLSVHPIIPRLIEAEWGVQVGQERSFGLHFDPSSGFLVNAAIGDANAIVDGILEYTLNVQETGTYYIFAQCRRENDQSDSVFIGFDSIDTTDEYAYPMTGSKNLTRRWWLNFEEGGRFWNTTSEVRPFELSAGEHKMYIAPRETNASIDWMVITADPNFNIGIYEAKETFYSVVRNLPDTGSTLPTEFQVTLDAGVVSNLDLRIEENLPQGWTANNANANDGSVEINGNQVVWILPELNADTSMTYTVVPAADASFGVFYGTAYDQTAGSSYPIIGKNIVPDIIPFQIMTDPIDVLPDAITFIQAESPHAYSGDYIVQADESLPSLLYAMPTSSGRSGGTMLDQELTFELNVLEAGTYYIFANARSESDQTDSFYIGFDVDFNGLTDSTESDRYGFVVPSRGAFNKLWHRLFEEGQRFWVQTDVLRPYELTAGSHTLNWHSREPEAKVDWIAITPDPNLDLTTVVDPDETPDSAIQEYMLY